MPHHGQSHERSITAGSVGSDNAAEPVLYTYYRSSCAYRVRIALHLKNLSFQSEFVNLVKGEQRDEKYASQSPSKLVPSLFIDGQWLTQSLAILEYLEETRPDTCPLLPKDPVCRAKVRSLAYMIAMDIQPVQNLRVLQKYASEPAQQASWATHWIQSGFEALEKVMATTAGTYAYGNTITLADVCLVPQVYNANRYGVKLDAFPTIRRVSATLETVDAFMRAEPSVQPDCPKTTT